MCEFCLPPPFAITGLGPPLRSFLKLNGELQGAVLNKKDLRPILGSKFLQHCNFHEHYMYIHIYIYIHMYNFNYMCIYIYIYLSVILYMLGIVCLLSNGHTPKSTSFPCPPERGPAPARRATSRWGWRRSPAALEDSTELFLSQTLKQWGFFITL